MTRQTFNSENHDEVIERCRACDSKDLYLQKDFPRKIALAIVAVGIVTVPWSYGLSLLVVALIDLVIFKLTRWMTVCYRCRSEYRGFRLNPHHKEFDRHVDELYQYGKSH